MRAGCHFVLLLVLSGSMVLLGQNGARLIDYNARSSGRGGTSIGMFDNNSLMITNPAGLSFLGNSRLEFNFSSMIPSLHFRNTINDRDGEDKYYPMPSLSYVKPGHEGRLSWGVGAFTIGGMGAEFNLNHPLFPTPQNYYSNLGIVQFGPSLAYKITDNLSVGFSAHLVYSMMDFRMPYSLSPGALQGQIPGMGGMTFGEMFAAPPTQGGFGYSEVTAYAAMKDLKGLGFNAKLGLAWMPSEQWTFGVVYNLPTPLNLRRGTAEMDMNAQFGDAMQRAVQGAMQQGMSQAEAQAYVVGMFTQMGIDTGAGVAASYELGADLEMPQSIGLGLSFRPGPRLRLAVDFEWLNWKRSFDRMTLTLADGQSANINLLMGNDGGFGIDFPMEWKDSCVLKFGVEHDLSASWTLRGGFVYGTNPVPDHTVFPVFPAIVVNHLTLGASCRLSRPLTLHVAFEKALDKDQTASADNIIAHEYRNSVSTLGNTFVHLALTWEL